LSFEFEIWSELDEMPLNKKIKLKYIFIKKVNNLTINISIRDINKG